MTRARPETAVPLLAYVRVIAPVAPDTAVPVAVLAITKLVEVGTMDTIAEPRLNAVVDSPVIVRVFAEPATRP